MGIIRMLHLWLIKMLVKGHMDDWFIFDYFFMGCVLVLILGEIIWLFDRYVIIFYWLINRIE
jgi:hypothetical protein